MSVVSWWMARVMSVFESSSCSDASQSWSALACWNAAWRFWPIIMMIGQNRQAAVQQAKADHDCEASEQELDSNTDITRAIHQLTTDIHDHLIPNGARGALDDDAASAARKPSNPQNNHSQKGT